MPGILLVLAHPDDESFVGGGVLTLYGRRGHDTCLICLSDGQAGRTGVSGKEPLSGRETIGTLRRRELREAARLLEIGRLVTPGWMDGALSQVSDEEGIRFVTRQVRMMRPEILISFGEEGGGNAHPDHKAAWRWSDAAFGLAADASHEDGFPPNEVAKFYWIALPESVHELARTKGSPVTTVVELSGEIEGLKRKAFAEHASQQDHRGLYEAILERQECREYFHLARSRVGFSEKIETDLYERIGGLL